MHALVLASVLVAPAQPAAHEEANPLYKTLIGDGIDVGGEAKLKFPKPTLADGLAKDKQTAAIKALISGKVNYDEFVRVSPVAPQIVTVDTKLPGGAKTAPARSTQVWFVAHGDFKKLEQDEFLDKLIGAGKGTGGKGGAVPAADLAKRMIVIADPKRETVGYVEFDFLDKVRLRLTGHAMWSRTGDSVVAAAEIDPRFKGDKDYPNEWRSVDKAAGTVGNPQPWGGAAMYLKITKLHEPEGAVFVEQHIIFNEPDGWFDGKSILTSKLPLVMRESVITFRKEFMKK
ncbi:MAG: hypothetical protein FJ304_12410 [Planctomycetes bacterium]|nr:hypothetical protein [Planctomycetota bacterium]